MKQKEGKWTIMKNREVKNNARKREIENNGKKIKYTTILKNGSRK